MKISHSNNTDLNIEWTTSQKNAGGSVVMRLRDMTEAHRERAVKQLHTFAADRKDGYDSFWYKTGKTIGQMIVILTGIGINVVGKKPVAGVAQKRKEKEDDFVMVPVKQHYRKVMMKSRKS